MKLPGITFRFLVLALSMPLLICCNQEEMDRQIKADITIKAKEDVNFSGLYYTVEDGLVTIWGKCATPDSRIMVRKKINTIHVIRALNDRVQIGPVVIGDGFKKKLQADSILAGYATVTAKVSGDLITLSGKLRQKDLNKLMTSFQEIHAGNVSTEQLRIAM